MGDNIQSEWRVRIGNSLKKLTKKDKTIDNKDNFSKDLNEVLLSCEPVSENLRKFIINGE